MCINYQHENTLIIQAKQSAWIDDEMWCKLAQIPAERKLFYSHVPVYTNHNGDYFPCRLLCYDAEYCPYNELMDGHKPWFSVFMDADGYEYTAYYRKPETGKTAASFLVTGINGDNIIHRGDWTQGESGLTHVIMDAIISDFAKLFYFELCDYQ